MTVGLALLFVAVLIGLLGSGITGLGRGFGDAVTKATTPLSPAVTRAVVDPSAPVTGAGLAGAPVTMDPMTVKKMPAHILDWLKHLERTEKKRSDLATNEVSELLRQMTMLSGVGSTERVMNDLLKEGADVETSDPAKEISEQGQGHKKDWKDLIAFFDSVPPPTECVPIRNAYAQCLGETSAMYTEILNIMGSIGDDPKAAVADLMKMQGKSNDRIDVAGRQTDRQVQEICDEYDVRKWFTVNTDIGGGVGAALSGLGGIIGK